MTIIQRSALVGYSCKQMYELVNAIEEYPRFLPWCKSSKILSFTDTEIVATLEIAWKGIHKKFTTKNTLSPNHKIIMTLVDGPFKSLEGMWQFAELKNHACKVSMDLHVEFTGNFIDRMFQPVFNHIANSLVDAFCRRAREIYGS